MTLMTPSVEQAGLVAREFYNERNKKRETAPINFCIFFLLKGKNKFEFFEREVIEWEKLCPMKNVKNI